MYLLILIVWFLVGLLAFRYFWKVDGMQPAGWFMNSGIVTILSGLTFLPLNYIWADSIENLPFAISIVYFIVFLFFPPLLWVKIIALIKK